MEGGSLLALCVGLMLKPLGLSVMPRAKKDLPIIAPALPAVAQPPAVEFSPDRDETLWREVEARVHEVRSDALAPAPVPNLPALEPMPLMERPVRRARLAPEEAATVFVEYLQAAGATGIYTYEEIDEHWRMACDALAIVHFPGQALREQLDALGYCKGRRQLTLEFPDVRARTGRTRATLYSIPAIARSKAGRPRSTPVRPGSVSSPPGQRPGNRENLNEIREAA